jgi:hypothetical protein
VELADVSIVTYFTSKSKSIPYLFYSGEKTNTLQLPHAKKVAPAEAGATSYYLVAP